MMRNLKYLSELRELSEKGVIDLKAKFPTDEKSTTEDYAKQRKNRDQFLIEFLTLLDKKKDDMVKDGCKIHVEMVAINCPIKIVLTPAYTVILKKKLAQYMPASEIESKKRPPKKGTP